MRKPRTKIQELRPNHFYTHQRLLLTRPDLKTIIAKGPEVSVLMSQVRSPSGLFDSKVVSVANCIILFAVKTVECKSCGKQVVKTTQRYNEVIKQGWNFFCSRSCRYGYQEKRAIIFCAQCQTSVQKTPAQIRKTKSHKFCSKSCAAKYNNSHKTYNTRLKNLKSFWSKG